MKKTISKKLWLVIVLAVIAGIGIVLAAASLLFGHRTAKETGNVMKDTISMYNLKNADGDYLELDRITSIKFLYSTSSMPKESSAVYIGDISAAQDGSVMAWAVEDPDTPAYILKQDSSTFVAYYEEVTGYAMYIAGKGGVDAGETCNSMFRDFTSLEYIEFNNCFYTGNVTDMSRMFGSRYTYDGLNLKEIDLRSLDTSQVTDMSEMFYGCSEMTTVKMSGWDTSQVTDMSNMFYGCESLITLDVSDWNTVSVTDMSCMFYYCESLITIDVSDWNTVNVTDMSSMFSCCFSLATLDVSRWSTANVTTMEDMFYMCSSLITLDVSRWITANVTDMSGMFESCSSLTKLDVSNWDVSNVKNHRYIFMNCDKLDINASDLF